MDDSRWSWRVIPSLHQYLVGEGTELGARKKFRDVRLLY